MVHLHFYLAVLKRQSWKESETTFYFITEEYDLLKQYENSIYNQKILKLCKTSDKTIDSNTYIKKYLSSNFTI